MDTATTGSKSSKTLWKVMGYDPGHTTGVAMATVTLEPKPKIRWATRSIPEKTLQAFLRDNTHKADFVVCEIFAINPTVKQWNATRNTSNDLLVANMFGWIQHSAFLAGIPFLGVRPAEKPMGYKKAGLKYVKGKSGTHEWDAMAHVANFISRQWEII